MFLLLFKPFEPLPSPLFVTPSLPSGDMAFNHCLLWVCCAWDLVDGIGGCLGVFVVVAVDVLVVQVVHHWTSDVVVEGS